MNLIPLGFGKCGNVHAKVKCNGFTFKINMWPNNGDVFVENVKHHSDVGVPAWKALGSLRSKLDEQDYMLRSTYKEIFIK